MDMMDHSSLFLIILLMPLAAAALIACLGRRRPIFSMTLSVTSALVGALAVLHFIYHWDGLPVSIEQEWFHLGQFTLNMGFYVESKAALLLFVVGVIGFLIHVFSVGYMKEDGARSRFFGGLSIFMFSMMGIVLADNLFMLFVFWELVGFSSYMLIAHYFDTEEAAAASKKAFIVNRVGDFAFLLGILWTYARFGTVNIVELQTAVGIEPSLVIAPIAFLLMGGFIGKSAQFPLHVWLPDAMAGPTPISALIHAATMVAAGIYFLCRVSFLFPIEVMHCILYLGCAMALYAGFCALAQRDIKKILAYSTLSQLGYMAAAFGMGYGGLALFHLTCHAFFKALLFLGAGSVIHACHHEQDIFKMGGLYRRMPLTTLTFAIGTAALCAVTFFSGYYSKEAIIEAAYLTHPSLYWVLLGAAFLTSIYMGRLFWIAFMGRPNSQKAEKAHESSWVMTLPLGLLAILALFGGMVRFWPMSLESVFLGQLESIHEHLAMQGVSLKLFAWGLIAWVFGLLFTSIFYRLGAKEDRLARKLPALYRFLQAKLWFDECYDAYVRQVQDRFANLLAFIDNIVIGTFIVRGAASVFGLMGMVFRALHVGSLHGYVYWVSLAMVGLAYWLIFMTAVS